MTLNGISTGVCDNSTGFCYINAWCAPEYIPKNESNLIYNVDEFTVFIRISVKWPELGIERNNANGSANQLTDNYNLFKVGYMTEAAQTNYSSIVTTGAIILVTSDWQCNFDYSADQCIPTFSFSRIDTQTNLSTGFNFRYVNYYYNDDVLTRDLIKATGLRFIVSIQGIGGQFNIVPLIVNIGSGLALISVATIVTDLILQYLMPKRKVYTKHKYEELDDPVDIIDPEKIPIVQSNK